MEAGAGASGTMLSRLVLLVMALFPLKILGYNPMYANCHDRYSDIIAEGSSFDVIMLAGTSAKRNATPFDSFYVQGRHVISSGFLKSAHANKSCGVSIILGKKVFQGSSFSSKGG